MALRKIPAGRNARDAQGRAAVVGNGDRLRVADRADKLGGKGKAGWRQTHDCTHACQAYFLRAAGIGVLNGEQPSSRTNRSGLESDTDHATRSRRDAGATACGLRVVAACRNPRNANGHAPVIGQRNGLSCTAGSHQLSGKSQTGGRESDGDSRTFQADLLGAAAGIVCDTQGAGLHARSGWLEADADRATDTAINRRTASMRLAEWPGHGDALDGQDSGAGVGERYCLKCAGGEDQLHRKSQGGRRQFHYRPQHDLVQHW